MNTSTAAIVLVTMVCAVGVFIAVRVMAATVRRSQLRSTLAAFPAFIEEQDGTWAEGTARYQEEALEWFRDGSVSRSPELRLPRHLLEMKRHAGDSAATRSLHSRGSSAGQDWIVADFTSPELEKPVTMALGFKESAGVSAWIEAWGSVGRGHWR